MGVVSRVSHCCQASRTCQALGRLSSFPSEVASGQLLPLQHIPTCPNLVLLYGSHFISKCQTLIFNTVACRSTHSQPAILKLFGQLQLKVFSVFNTCECNDQSVDIS